MGMLVSAIVPVYNVAPWLREAVDSLVQQTYEPVEIILVDDGSTDESGRICDEYARRWPERIQAVHQENRGLSGARNTGLDRMHGEAVVFLDPDDAFDVKMIEQMVNAQERYQAEVVICGYAVYRSAQGQKMAQKRRGQVSAPARENLLTSREALQALVEGKISHAAWDKLYLRRVWENLRYPESRVYEDVSTTYQVLSAAGNIAVIPDVLVMHRVRAGSITQTKSLQNFRDWMTAVKEYEAFVRDHVPALFDEQQFFRIQEQDFRGMVHQWAVISRTDQGKAADVRAEILRDGGRFMHRPVYFRTWTAYQMIRFCPRMIPLVLPVYRFFRLLLAKVTGR